MRIVGPRVLAAFGGRILNIHPSLLPAFPGAHAVADALAHGVTVTGCTVHLVDADARWRADPRPGGGPGPPRRRRSEPRDADPRSRAPAAAAGGRAPRSRARWGSTGGGPGSTTGRAERNIPFPRRALLSVSDKTGLVELGRGLVGHGFELVSTGGTARALRDAGLAGHRRGGRDRLARDARWAGQDPPSAGPRRPPGRSPSRATTAGSSWTRRSPRSSSWSSTSIRSPPRSSGPGISIDELIEEIDIGGPSMVRAAAKNHANVAIVTSPARYGDILAALEAARASTTACGARSRSRRSRTPRRTTPGSPRRCPGGWPRPDCIDAAGRSVPGHPHDRPREGRHASLRREPAPAGRPLPAAGSTAADGPFATGEPPLQGKALSYNNVLDAAAAAALGRALRGPGCVIVKHTNPCGAAERLSLLEAWEAALAGDPVSAFGGVVALTRPVDAAIAEALVSIFLEVVVAPGVRRRGPGRSSRPSPTCASSSTQSWPIDEPLPPPDPTGVDPHGGRGGPRQRARHHSPTTRRPGPSPPAARRPTPRASTSTSPGGSSAA